MRRASVSEVIARVVPELYALTPLDRYPAHAARVVRQAVGGDKCDVTELDLLSGEFRVLVVPAPPQLAELAEARRAHMGEHPLLGLLRGGPDAEPHAVSDVLTPTQYHRLGLYAEFFRPLDVEDQLAVGFVDRQGRVSTGFTVDRGRRGFGSRERAVMRALRPHLIAARRNATDLTRLLTAPATTTPKARTGDHLSSLTDRQREVLTRMSTGSTNAQIALELDISEGTVRKHVENVLRTLGIHSRTAAAAIYLQSNAATAVPWTATIGSFA